MYAAIVGTIGMITGLIGLWWQIHSWHKQRMSSVRVTLDQWRDSDTGWEIRLKAFNDSDYSVRVEVAGFYVRGFGRLHIPPPRDSTMAQAIAPHDAGEMWLARSALEKHGVDLRSPKRHLYSCRTGVNSPQSRLDGWNRGVRTSSSKRDRKGWRHFWGRNSAVYS